MRRVVLAVAALLGGCAELGVISDGTSLSIGKPSRGYLVDGVPLPDQGEGFTTPEVWRSRGNRFGTDELVDLVTAVARRMRGHARDARLVVADLSGVGGGEQRRFHRSHQTGRDVDLLYYMRDAAGQPFEPDAMRPFGPSARARDGSGLTVDVPRTWLLVKELVTAPEATVQWVFMYEPIAQRLLDHARAIGEPEAVIARARMTLAQPGDSARHDDHLHVRVYCAAADRAFGCVDIGPMERYALRLAEPSPLAVLIAALTTGAPAGAPDAPLPSPAVAAEPGAIRAAGSDPASAAALGAATAITVPHGLRRLLRTRADRIRPRGWR